MLVWPDLVYTELICMVAMTALMLVWALALQAPLEEPASSVKTPNPSKAPWYFLGLQEMLVYYDPWMAGVVLPSMVVVGLMAIPLPRLQQEGQRLLHDQRTQVRYIMFQFGFFVLWITLIVMGTFLRGPNWNFFGPFESWDAAQGRSAEQRRPVAILLDRFAGQSNAKARRGSGAGMEFLYILLRELPGIIADGATSCCCRR